MNIYLIKNKINDKKYVGQTTQTIKERWRNHCFESKKSTYILHKAIRKYGKENFSIEKLDTASSQKELNEKEIFWIAKLGSFGGGYNMTTGGENLPSQKGKEKTAAHKQMLSKANRGKISWRKGKTFPNDDGTYVKLTRNQVREIREKYACGKYSQATLGKEYGVKEGTVWSILKNLSWVDKNYIPTPFPTSHRIRK